MIPLRDVSPEDLEEGDPLLDNNSSSSSSKIKPKDYISANFENSSFRDDELLSYINRHTNSTPGFRNYFNNFLHNIFNTNTLSKFFLIIILFYFISLYYNFALYIFIIIFILILFFHLIF